MNGSDLFAAFHQPEVGPHVGAPTRKLAPLAGPPSAEEQALGMARQSDPPTSDAAAVEHVASGRAKKNEDRVVWVVREQPGLTATEIEAAQHGYPFSPLERHEVSRRLSSAEGKGRIKKGPKRKCTIKVNEREMVTWWPAE